MLGYKVGLGVAALAFIYCLLHHKRSLVLDLQYQLSEEKKYLRKVNKRQLGTFMTKIVTHVKASPCSFCLVLTNPRHYKDFKYQVPHQEPLTKKDPKKEKELEEQSKAFVKNTLEDFTQIDQLQQMSPVKQETAED